MSDAMQIRVKVSSDWSGVEHTDRDIEAYEQAVATAIANHFPGSDVEVETALVSQTQVRIYSCLPSEEEAVEETCRDIVRKVWDDAEFWTEA